MVPAPFFGKSGTPGSVSARTVRKICTRGGESGKMSSGAAAKNLLRK